MFRPIFFITVAFGLIVVSPQVASAAMCFQYTKSGGGISVAQANLPEPNTCITFALYEVGTKPGTTLLGAGTGSLCRPKAISSSSTTHTTLASPWAAITTSSRGPAGSS
jgi:hypothetical protein